MQHVDGQRTRLRRALLAITWLLGSLAAFAGLYLLAVHTATGQTLDTAVMVRLGDLADRNAVVEQAATLLGWVSPATVLLATVAVGLLALMVHGAATAAAALVTAVGTILGAQVLKLVLVRPDVVETSSAFGSNSLPSGHAAAVAGVLAALVIGLRLHASRAAWLVAGLLTGVTGLATVVLQWHRPSDIVASALLAIAVASVAWWATGQGRVVYRRRESVPHVTAA